MQILVLDSCNKKTCSFAIIPKHEIQHIYINYEKMEIHSDQNETSTKIDDYMGEEVDCERTYEMVFQVHLKKGDIYYLWIKDEKSKISYMHSLIKRFFKDTEDLNLSGHKLVHRISHDGT